MAKPNKAPTFKSNKLATGLVTEDSSSSTGGALSFSDSDKADTHEASFSPAAGGYVGTFEAHVSTDTTGGGFGTVTWGFSVDNSALQFLAAGQTSVQTYTITITDSNGNTATHDVAITLTGVNDAPLLDASKTPVGNAVLEDAGAPVVGAGTLVSSLVDFASPSGQVDNVTDVDSGALLGIAITAADAANGTWSYSLNGGATWTLLGAVSDATARLLAADADNRLYFQPNANYDGEANITFRAWDRTSGTDGGTANTTTNGGTTAFSTATDTATFDVTAVNDAPLLDASKTPVGNAVLEDAGAPGVGAGTLVSSLVDFASPSGQVDNVTDVDSGALLGIAITAADAANGTWSYSLNGGATWTLLGAVSDATARLLAADADNRLYFQPNANYDGEANITFRAWDRTSGTDGGTANTVPNGGTTAFSTATDTATFDVTAVNDAPLLDASKTPVGNAVLEDAGAPGVGAGTLVSSLVDFASPSGQVDNVTDVDSGALLGIAITAADAANGTWSYSLNGGATWTLLGAVSDATARLLAADADNRLYFQPNANYDGEANITFRAWDRTSGTDGGTANTTTNGGTTAFSTATDTATFDVTAVNDAPLLDASKTPVGNAVLEDAGAPGVGAGTLVSSLVDFASPSGQVDNVTDVDSGALLGIAITAADAANGTWSYSLNGGATWTLLGAVSDATARLLAADADNRLYFQPNANYDGEANITFRAWDRTSDTDGGTANTVPNGGTTAFSTATDTATFDVTPQNDADHFIVVRGYDGTSGSYWKIQNGFQTKIDIHDLGGFSNVAPVVTGGVFYFAAGGDFNLWKYDGTVLTKIDVNPNGSDGVFNLRAIGDDVYFRAYDGSDASLWKYDGTNLSGPLVDTRPGANDDVNHITPLGTDIYFTANDNSVPFPHRVLWKYDTVSQGLTLIDTNPVGADSFQQIDQAVRLGGSDYIVGFGNPGTGPGFDAGLWEYSGGNVATKNVDTNPTGSDNVKNLTALGSSLYFTASDGSNYGWWKYAGGIASNLGANVLNLGAGSEIFSVGAEVYFLAKDGASSGNSLWKVDGTTAIKIDTNAGGNDGAKNVVVAGTNIYFTAFDEASDYALWKHDGTTLTKIDVVAGNDSAGGQPFNNNNVVALGSNVYFTALDNDPFQYAVWKYDGSILSKLDSNPAGFDSPNFLAAAGASLYFLGQGPTEYSLWKYDGSLAPIETNPSGPDNPTGVPISSNGSFGLGTVGDSIFFRASNPSGVQTLFQYDGSALTEIETARQVSTTWWAQMALDPVVGIGDQLVFVGTDVGSADPSTGSTTIWTYDGFDISNLNTNPSGFDYANLSSLVAVGGHAYFSASSNNLASFPIWDFNGTTVAPIPTLPVDFNSGGSVVAVGTDIFFNGVTHPSPGIDQNSLYKYDTTDGTTTRIDSNSGPGGYFGVPGNDLFELIHAATRVGDHTYFIATALDGTGAEEERGLWQVDDTAPTLTAVRVDVIPSVPDRLQVLAPAGDDLYFTYSEPGSGYSLLGYYNGTDAPTVFNTNSNLFYDVDEVRLGPTIGDTLYFTAMNDDAMMALWKAQAGVLTEIANVFPSEIHVEAIGSNVYFAGYDVNNGFHQLYQYDGADSDLVLPDLQGVSDLFSQGDDLYFTASDNFGNHSLFRYDTVDHTVLRFDSNSNGLDNFNFETSFGPPSIATVGGATYVSGSSSTERSLWELDSADGTVTQVDFNPYSSDWVGQLNTIGDRFYFVAYDGTDFEMWTGDGENFDQLDATPGLQISGINNDFSQLWLV